MSVNIRNYQQNILEPVVKDPNYDVWVRSLENLNDALEKVSTNVVEM